MSNLFDDSPIELSCPLCGHKFSETVGKLKTEPTLTCPGCNSPIEIDAKGLIAGLEQAGESIADLGRFLDDFNKRK